MVSHHSSSKATNTTSTPAFKVHKSRIMGMNTEHRDLKALLVGVNGQLQPWNCVSVHGRHSGMQAAHHSHAWNSKPSTRHQIIQDLDQ